jgi:hypothetical protein
MKRIGIVAIALLAAGACRSRATLSPPEPARVKVDRTPAQVVQSAASELTTAGFQVTSSDRNRGVLTAQLAGRTNDLRPFIKCAPRDEAGVMQLGTSVITVTVDAQADGCAHHHQSLSGRRPRDQRRHHLRVERLTRSTTGARLPALARLVHR